MVTNMIIMGIQLIKRRDSADKVQQLLTDYGCFIKTRLGLHYASDDREVCSENGVIVLQFIANADKEVLELEDKLRQIKGVAVRKMVF